jgi:acetate kinase
MTLLPPLAVWITQWWAGRSARRTSLEAAVDKNAASEDVISTDASRVAVRVIRTDEERMIAKTVCRVLGLG